MAYQYVNRRGDVYHLQLKRKRSGEPAYSFARKPSGEPAERVPDGYEVYEEPEGAQVFVRKIRPTAILPLEKQMTEAAVRSLAGLEYFVVTTEAKSLIVHTSDADPDDTIRFLSADFAMSPGRASAYRDRAFRDARYAKMMRFTLGDEQARFFSADRWCFLGGIDDWYPLAYGKPLVALLERYVPHLGKESFFELGGDRW